MWERTKLKARNEHYKKARKFLKEMSCDPKVPSMYGALKSAWKRGFDSGWNAALDFYIRSKDSVPSNECIPLDILDLK